MKPITVLTIAVLIVMSAFMPSDVLAAKTDQKEGIEQTATSETKNDNKETSAPTDQTAQSVIDQKAKESQDGKAQDTKDDRKDSPDEPADPNELQEGELDGSPETLAAEEDESDVSPGTHELGDDELDGSNDPDFQVDRRRR